MAGIGPIFTNRRDLLKRALYRPALTEPKSELEIFLSLCVGRVFFNSQNNSLYFVDSPALSVTDIIQTVFRGLGQKPRIRQLYMDEHQLINAAFRIELTPRQKKLLLVALTLNGIHINTV